MAMNDEQMKITEYGMEVTLFGAQETIDFGHDLGLALAQRNSNEGLHCILLFGEMGTGKTTLTRGLISALPGGEDSEVSSPSFTLYNIYPTTPPVTHCDLYRSETDTLPDDVAELLDENCGLVLIEWAERIGSAELPPKRLDICFRTCQNNRLVRLKPRGDAACSVLQELLRLRSYPR